ncbi:exodeoxyribonuclease V subunit gamma [Halochromatium roseum]|uniref:exodeoxyribonuclease V subunit gamma n=1 Tax=Halochromatium roseum TaxID=391920 RepID=UPI001F5D2132|nr:exodeoxyribonuclease V subunit gamma [Halochromatium roseum]MBK5941229.1 exodeoxyribonuclease V subunit gamma [Halochromatium roseum]
MTETTDQARAWPTGFMLIQGNRLEALRGLLSAWLIRHPLQPLENEVILVQSNGIGQWLKLALAAPRAEDIQGDDPRGQDSSAPADDLSGGCGIAAALDLMLPARFLWQAYRAVLGDLPERSADDKAPLTWRLYRLLGELDTLASTPDERTWLNPLRGFLSSDGDARRRQQLAARLADLYDQYQVYRADWLSAWEQGEDVLIRPNGSQTPIPEDHRWQPLLWRRLRQSLDSASRDALGNPSADDLGHPSTGRDSIRHATSGSSHLGGATTDASRAQIHQRFLAQAKTLSWATRPSELPRRVIVFGISSLPRQTIEVLEAIAPIAQVMLFVHNPSQHYWGDLVEGRELFRRAYQRTAQRKVPEAIDEAELHLHGHPLLAAWGKQGRDYIRLLDEHDERGTYEAQFAQHDLKIDLFESPLDASDPHNPTLLQQLQDDILELRPLHERRALATAIDPRQDRSLSFLIAHGPQREVEILHDQLLDAFASAKQAGTALHPRDILVMVPDISVYAPHIEAVFGRLERDDPRRIPFQITDQSPRQRDPLLIGVETLLNLPQSRFAVSDLLDLLEIPALRARIGLSETDLPRLRPWIEGAKIRWGLDAAQRAGLDLPGLEQNSWHFGLKRLLLGFANGGSAAWQGIEPFDEIGGLDAALIGPLAQLLDSLGESWRLLQQPRTPAAWSTLLAERLEALFLASSEADERALAQLRQALEQWLLDATDGGLEDEPLPLEVVRDSLLPSLDTPTLSQRFLAGAVNFATLMPMRAIPFRQIWLLGMNDGDYPRSRRPTDFDLMANDYRPGDRSRREDDRYLFLEALLAARERLVISWVGRSLRDDSERPPSVLVGQLRDHLQAGWRLAPEAAGAASDTSGQALLAALTRSHPLQPFSRRYFEPGRDPRLFTYADEWRRLYADATAADGADVTAATDAAAPAPLFPERPPRLSPPTFDGPISLQRLGRFLRHPLRTFYTQRLALHLEREAETALDEEPFDLDALQRWGLRDAILQRVERQLVAQPGIASETCLQQAVDRLARAGELPLAPFDAHWRDDLRAQFATALQRYRALLAAYPTAVPIRALSLSAGDLLLEDSLTGLRANAQGERLQLRLQASELIKKDQLSWSHLVTHWPRHLAAQHEAPTRTCLLGPGSEVWLPALDWQDRASEEGGCEEGEQAGAATLLESLMLGYVEALTQPLPLACKTAFGVLRDKSKEKGAKPAEDYEGNDRYRGERDAHVGYARFWPDFATLSAAEGFDALIERLYGPLYQQAITHQAL